MKKLQIIWIFLLSSFILNAQEVVSSAGETQKTSEYEVSFTVGETVIQTLSEGTSILTQGFHQTKLTVTPITEFLLSGIELKVFPNPTNDFVNIHFTKLIDPSVYQLFDNSGKLLENKKIVSTNTLLNLQKYAGGQYILKLTGKSNQALQTFKIIKK